MSSSHVRAAADARAAPAGSGRDRRSNLVLFPRAVADYGILISVLGLAFFALFVRQAGGLRVLSEGRTAQLGQVLGSSSEYLTAGPIALVCAAVLYLLARSGQLKTTFERLRSHRPDGGPGLAVRAHRRAPLHHPLPAAAPHRPLPRARATSARARARRTAPSGVPGLRHHPVRASERCARAGRWRATDFCPRLLRAVHRGQPISDRARHGDAAGPRVADALSGDDR